ncbi:nucleotidyltransferase domain-containing protein [candidate division KSB1 bacterium]|nr:MAG: nucleotidyltransferase domain-containing protein [candidate division KSB1 bacterium]
MDNVKNLVDKLKEAYKPELVILFGSGANGKFDKDSDIDLLIVKETKKRPLWRRIEVRKILATEQPVDVIVYTPDEFNKLKKDGRSFIKDVIINGKILFERR